MADALQRLAAENADVAEALDLFRTLEDVYRQARVSMGLERDVSVTVTSTAGLVVGFDTDGALISD